MPMELLESSSDEFTSTQTPELNVESTTQVIEFNLNGKNERFIVARQVTVEVLPPEPSGQFDLESEPLLNTADNSLLDD